jgi:hypothetical protein
VGKSVHYTGLKIMMRYWKKGITRALTDDEGMIENARNPRLHLQIVSTRY